MMISCSVKSGFLIQAAKGPQDALCQQIGNQPAFVRGEKAKRRDYAIPARDVSNRGKDVLRKMRDAK